jgi:hypothetical protein
MPSMTNWTPTTPTLSEPEAESVTAEPVTVAPDAGAAMATVGGVLSGPVVPAVLLTVTVTADEVV